MSQREHGVILGLLLMIVQETGVVCDDIGLQTELAHLLEQLQDLRPGPIFAHLCDDFGLLPEPECLDHGPRPQGPRGP